MEIYRVRNLLLAVMLSVGVPIATAQEDGLLRKPSPHPVDRTLKRFEEAIRAKGLKVFPQFDHAAAAREYDKKMNPTVVVPFGNPKYGTPFMIQKPESGIDFPPKAIIYEDQDGKVWIAYNSAAYLYKTVFRRHGLEYKESDIDSFSRVLEELTDYAVRPER